jgi:hypothetical protein
MQASSPARKFSTLISSALNNLMVAAGTLSFIWIMAFLIVAMFGN